MERCRPYNPHKKNNNNRRGGGGPGGRGITC